MDTKLKAFATFILILVAISLVVVLALVWTMPDLPRPNNNICLPGVDGVLTCGSTPDLLKGYLERNIATKYEEIKVKREKKQQEYLDRNRDRLKKVYDKSYWEMKPAARLSGKKLSENRTSDTGSDMTPINAWRNGRELYDTNSFEMYGIRYRNGRLVVPVDGTYFVYSSVAFFVTCDGKTGKPDVKIASKPIKHGIYKFNIFEQEEAELISSVQPHVVSDNIYFFSYNSYVSTVAELKAGDELSVKVSNITYLRYTRYNSFGLYLV